MHRTKSKTASKKTHILRTFHPSSLALARRTPARPQTRESKSQICSPRFPAARRRYIFFLSFALRALRSFSARATARWSIWGAKEERVGTGERQREWYCGWQASCVSSLWKLCENL